MTKWIFVSGGVLSGLGKGLFSASASKLLQSKGHKVVPIKCDGYLNVDPGTMNPFEHGEVFVLNDGGEVDMDFGHYERFLGINGKFDWNLTSGKVFKSVIEKERKGEYLGKTVQLIPHVTEEIKNRFEEVADNEDADIVIIEVGGTVGDMENEIFLEAIRQMRNEKKEEDTAYIHLTLVPYLESVGELKTKPTQHSIKDLQERGIKPDFIIGRSDRELNDKIKEKISLFCNVPKEAVISNRNIGNIYRLPLLLEEQNMDELLLDKLKLSDGEEDLKEWRRLVEAMENPKDKLKIAMCGKYTDLEDSYVSIIEALKHASAHKDVEVKLKWIETTNIENNEESVERALKDVDGVIIPGGFGSRGAEGKIKVARFSRENDIPILGLCLGLQIMVTEYARNVCGLEDANSTEVDQNTDHPVVFILPEQREIDEKGGTMRLGGEKTVVKEETRAENIYQEDEIEERFRHRYEVNPNYYKSLKENGLVFSGSAKGENIKQIIELPEKKHPFYFGTQFHPEFTSSLEDPSPVFMKFVESCL